MKSLSRTRNRKARIHGPMSDFVIVYELKTRELESVVLLGEELKRRGYSVDYLKFPVRPRYLLPGLRKRAGVVIIPAAYDENTLYMMVFRAFRAASKVLNLQWEQVWTVAAESDVTNFRIPQGLARQVVHACWGDNTRKVLYRSGVSESRLQVSGPIHMDFFGRYFSDFYPNKEVLFDEFGLSETKYTILFISTFSYTTLTEAESSGLKANFNAEDFDTFRDLSVNSKAQVLEWLANLLEVDANVTVIYRPHPAEKESSDLSDLIAKHSNFHVIGAHSIGQWIRCVDKIYTWYSTSIGEVYYGGKSCEILRPIPIPELREVAVMRAATFTQNREMFLAGIYERGAFPVTTDVMHTYYDVNQEMPSYYRTATTLEDILNDPTRDVTWPRATVRLFRKRLRADLRRSVHAALLREARMIRLRLGTKLGLRAPRAEESRLSYLNGREKLRRQAASSVELAVLAERIKPFVARVAADQTRLAETRPMGEDPCPS